MNTKLKIKSVCLEVEGSAQEVQDVLRALPLMVSSLISGVAENGCVTKAKKRDKLQAPVTTPKSRRGTQSRTSRSGSML